MLLFTAPLDFDPKVLEEYFVFMETQTKSNVTVSNSFSAHNVTIWVCDPSANFVIDDAVLDQYPNLKILATPSTGINHIDLSACKHRGIKVLSLLDDRAGLETISASAEFTFKLLLDAFRKPPARELQGKNIGLVGYGRIGKRIAKYASAFGMNEIHYDPILSAGCGASSLEHIFEWGNAVVICCTYDATTRGMITKDHILSMKHSAALVNTARGEIIDEQGLYEALAARPDIRFATDVVHGEVEGRAEESRAKLRALGAIVSSHIAGATFDSRTKAAKIILSLLQKELTLA